MAVETSAARWIMLGAAVVAVIVGVLYLQPDSEPVDQPVVAVVPMPELVPIPAGRFTMGSERGLDIERPPRTVTIDYDFKMSRHEITFDQYDHYARETGLELPDDRGWGRGGRPAIYVGWNEAVAYAEWLSNQIGQACRLPSEAEWEYAARAGSTGDYGMGMEETITEFNLVDYAWFSANADRGTLPVGTRKPNAWGLYDMHGNVWEWVQDCWWDGYQNAPVDGSAREYRGCDRRALRGGAWFDHPFALRSAQRGRFSPDTRTEDLGFRVVCVPRS